MKKYLLILLGFMMLPIMVLADETCDDMTVDEYCKGTSCLNTLKREYNTWTNSGNGSQKCIKVIGQIKGNSLSYLTGKDPEKDYKCSNGNTVNAKRISTAIAEASEVTDCNDETCYVPEIWLMDCTSTATSNGNTNSGNTIGGSSSGSTSNNVSNGTSNNSDVSTNSNGQITGTTGTSDTGVETYFIVLIILAVLSYSVLAITKNKNLFKKI